MRTKLPLLLLCVAIGIVAYVFLNIYSARHAPLYRRLEIQWREDVEQMEASHKLPRAWSDLHDVEVIGGTPETKEWLAKIKVPVAPKADGHYHMEILVVAWEEDGKHGALIQYNVEELKSKNTVFEIGRTLILSRPEPKDPLQAFIQDFHP